MEDNKDLKTQYDEKQGDGVTKAVRENRNTMPYITASSCTPIGAVVPTKLAYETVEALNKFVLNNTDTTEFVREKLGYESKISVCDAFASEQVDAIALAIVQAERQKGFILGDMAGIGKGRVVAGVLRYAKKQGKIPVFVSIKTTLFTDIYRDFKDIGGFGGDEIPVVSEKNLPTPLIMNNDSDAVIKYRKEGENELSVLFSPMKREDLRKITDRGVLPKGVDLIMLTYSQLNANLEKETPRTANAISKFKFLQGLSDKMFFVLDESHCGAGDGNSAKNLFNLISLANGVVFSSATYSKEPKSMMLYIPKTDIVDSNIRPSTIVQAVKESGEAVQEYIASMLVKSGQMIRRERTFDKCKIEYNYIKTNIKKYYDLYDKVMSLYNEIEVFSKSSLYKDALKKARVRVADEEGFDLVPENDPMPTEEEFIKEWQHRNRNKYVMTYDPSNRVKNRFQWIENLLFSIKADYVANEVVKTLTSLEDDKGKPLMTEYRFGDSVEMINTNFKPVIGIRNTAESSLKDLGYKLGQKIKREDNDYAKTLINIAKGLTSAKATFEPVNKSKTILEIENCVFKSEDFEDNGVEYNKIIAQMSTATTYDEKTGEYLPLSPIDYMIDRIESTPRPNWDKKYTSSEYYRVEEITKRSLSVRKVKGEDYFEVVTPPQKTTMDKVDNFNTGKSDVIIINTAGSTGLSLHSSISDEFKDKRPRILFLHQVELDVYTEVQKRGRINRTGQVNNPAYTYVVSCIPSEVRKLLMLRRKLRSLDATTTGNVKQSAKASQILDKEGNEIEDMTNKYGYQVLLDFVNIQGNEQFKGLVEDKWYTENSSPEDKFDIYLREIEKLPCVEQEKFYNGMNSMYTSLMNSLKANDEWDLETTIEDLKSSTMNKKVLYEGSSKNEFTKSVYIEDKFVTSKGIPYTKEQLKERMDFLAQKKDYTDFHNELNEEFEEHAKDKMKKLRESFGKPDTSVATTQEEKDQIVEDFETMVKDALLKEQQKDDLVRYPLAYFKPDKILYVPVDTDMLKDGAFDDKKDRKRANPKIGKFVGFKINNKSDNKWSPMNIELEFASTSRLKPHIRISLTKQYRGIIDWIMDVKAHEISLIEVAEVKAWIIKKTSERDKMRVLTGELFRGFEMAQKLWGEDINYERKKRLIKYSTSAGTVETGIKMWLQQWKPLTEMASPTFTAINSDVYKDAIKTLKGKLWWSSNNEFIEKEGSTYKMYFCTGYDIIRGGKERSKPQKQYISQFTKSVLEDLQKAIGSPYSEKRLGSTYDPFEMYSKGTTEDVNQMKFYYFSLNEDKLFELLDVIFERFKIMENLKDASKGFILEKQVDPLEKGGGDIVGETQGIYDYFLTTRFDETAVPPNYIKDSFRTTPDNDYGMFSLYYPVSVVEGGIYKIVPANITQQQAVRNILNSIADDNQRLDYINGVKSMKDDYIGIAKMTQEIIGINPIYAIGLVTPKYAGKVISSNIDNPVIPSADVDAEKVEVQAEAIEKVPISWDTVQDFMIKFKSL
ncbi:MAG: strawberry notch C-terminal domain-containing protein [archaeon]